MTFSEIVLVGNVGRDPELRFTPSGNAVCDFSLAVNRSWTQDGEQRKETTWFKVTVWNQQAETVHQYVTKGKQVLVVGDRIEASAYMSKDGEPRASLDVTARTVRFLGGRDESSGGGEAYSASDDRGDDIPF